jgi:hypothetical protein
VNKLTGGLRSIRGPRLEGSAVHLGLNADFTLSDVNLIPHCRDYSLGLEESLQRLEPYMREAVMISQESVVNFVVQGEGGGGGVTNWLRGKIKKISTSITSTHE